MVDLPQRSGALLVDRSARGKLAFTGEQALWFCDQLLTNQLVNLAPGQGAEALMLTPHGRIVAALRLAHPAEGQVLADLEPPASRAAELAGFFAGRIFATRVAVRDMSEELGLFTLLGPAADEIARAALHVSQESMPGREEHASAQVGDVVVVRVVRPGAGLELFAPRGQCRALTGELERAGAEPVSEEGYDELRIRSGLARDRVDYDDSFLPQEAAMERAVHFAKGCYLGQEAVAMAQRGRVKRRVRQLQLEGEAKPGPLFAAGADGSGGEVGRLTSIAGPG
ncbi:MAG TPA: hypothetical protein VHA57_00165, partial [Actinomycetota bacterium]|nr:hypothetical protein [Actinomycetota bacterium]